MKIESLPDYAKKFKVRGYDVKKVGNEYYQYKVEHYRVENKNYPVTRFIYIGKIDKVKGLIKSNQEKDEVIAYLEYGLSNYIFNNYKRALQRSLFNISGENATNLIKLGIIKYIYKDINLNTLKYSYLTYFDSSKLWSFYDLNKHNQVRANKISSKIEDLLSSVFYDDLDRQDLLTSLKNMNAIIYQKHKKINTIYSDNVKSIFRKYKIRYE